MVTMEKVTQIKIADQRAVISCVDNSDQVLRERIKLVFDEQGIELLDASDLEMALGYLVSPMPQPILVQFAGFGPEAISFLESVHSLSPDAPVIVLLMRDSVTDAVRFIRNGAFGCLGPGSTPDELFDAVGAASDYCTTRRAHQPALEREPWRKCLIGQSPALDKIAKIIRIVAPRRCSVLISGETGTGKEMAARAIHQASDRARRPMISVNCSALPANLIEAELFGHVKGAFTGAIGNRIGRFEQADGGTLFLDEIGDIPFDLQAKLLRALQEREIQRLGGTETVKVDVRLIAATNADLLARMHQGLFREDLYYRLNVIPIHMPTLRERITDVPLLVNHFVGKVCAAEGLPAKSVTSSAMSLVSSYSWPGNVRQLENIVEQAVVMNASHESLDASAFSLPKTMQTERASRITLPTENLPDEGMDFPETLRRFERGILDQALLRTQGNKTLAAEMLRLPRTTLVNKLRALETAA
jgi:DNA-binding NtrC family response regulator